MKKFISALLMLAFLAFIGLTPNHAHASSLKLEPLARCCLPELGRMQKGTTDACHCPPEKLCPVSLDDWNAAKDLPKSIASVCCPMPRECTVQRTVMQACGSVSRVTVDTSVKMCFNFIVKGADTNGASYKAALALVKVDETRLQAIREEIRVLSNPGTSDDAYNRVTTLVNEGKALEAHAKKVIEDANKADSKAKLEINCALDTTTKCCTNHVSQPCPPPPNPPASCRITAGQWGGMSEQARADMNKRCGSVDVYDCVAEGTMVLMADGLQKAIQDIKIGEFVKGYNSNNRVTGLSLEEEGAAFLHSINNGKLNITAQHPILTTKGWKAIEPEKVIASEEFKAEVTRLMVGDEIIIPDENVIIVTSIGDYIGPKVATYNLAVNGDRTFIANGMVIRAYSKNNSY